MEYVKSGSDGNEYIDWKKMQTVKWSDPKFMEQLASTNIILPPDDRIFGKKEIDPNQIIFHSEVFDLKEAAKRENAGKPRSKFILKKDVPIYPEKL